MPDEALNITLVILAAGASTRMGTPKQLLPWGENNLINHTINTALRTGAKKIVIVLGANKDIIKKEVDHFPITVLINEQWQQGLGTSIACASNRFVDHISNIFVIY